MSSFFHPNLLTTDQLRDDLKKRFPTQNLAQLERNQLLQLFSSYAVPKGRRNAEITNINEVEMRSADELNQTNLTNNKRSRHSLIAAPSVETVTNACKRIRLVNSNGIQANNGINNNSILINSQKRQIVDSQMDCVMSNQSQRMPLNTKRKKITWP